MLAVQAPPAIEWTRSVARLARNAKKAMEKSWRWLLELCGFDTSRIVKPEPQCVTKIFGPVKSFYGRAQIVMVEQWRRAAKLGKVVAANAHEQIANRQSRVRGPW